MSFRAYFVSDLHLKSDKEQSAQIFVRFLNRICEDSQTTHLFLVGDIFDFWVSDHTYFIEKFSSVVSGIDRVVQKGIEVHYFEGNHDLHLERYWQRKMGIKVHQGPEYFQIENTIIRVEHGDLIDPDDKGYLFLKSVLQTKAMKYFSDHANEKLISLIGEKASQASRKYTTETKTISEDRMRKKHRDHANKVYKKKPYDLLVSGHIHLKDDYVFQTSNENESRAVNLGTWLKEPLMFLCTEKGAEFQILV